MKDLLFGALMVAVIGPATAGARSPADPAVTAILAANRAAVGETPRRSMLTLVYRYAGSGLDGTLTTRIDLPTGAYVETTDAGGVTEGAGFDGRTPWQRDISGSYTAQQGGDRVRLAIDYAYRYANGWWSPDRNGAAITRLADESAGGGILQHLSITPQGGKRFDAWFDGKTHLLAKVAYDDEFLHVTETYSDYRREGPQILAHRISVDKGLGESAVSTSTLEHCAYAPEMPLDSYSRPDKPLTDADIADGASTTTVPFRLLNNHVYVQATVNGKGPYTFIVDTGGHTLLSPHLIAQVGLRAVGAAVTSGAGEGHGTTGFVHYDEIAIGGVRLHDQVGFATDIYDQAIEGIPVDGMVGFELLRRMVTSIDYGRHTITFTAPRHFRAVAATGVAVPFVFYDHVPNVPGRIGKLPARFDIDTGSRSALDITSPFVKRHRLRARFADATLAVTGFGVGGPARSYVTRMPEVSIGGVSIRDPVVDLSDARAGTFSDPNFDGNIGSALLKRFVVTFDYAHQLMYLKRIEPVPADVGTFDRSGLWINAHGDAYQVVDVARGSAGAAADVEVGDLILAVAGHPVSESGLADTRREFRTAAAGTPIELTIQRGTTTRAVTLVLRDQIPVRRQ